MVQITDGKPSNHWKKTIYLLSQRGWDNFQFNYNVFRKLYTNLRIHKIHSELVVSKYEITLSYYFNLARSIAVLTVYGLMLLTLVV